MRDIAICLIILYLSSAISQDLNHKVEFTEILEKYQNYLSDNSIFIEKSNPCQSPGWNYLISGKLDLTLCPELTKALATTTSNSVTAVYASSYYSNPASVFGHLFLLFQNNNEPKFMNLSLNYAAQIPKDSSAIEYVYRGLFGGFKGVFSMLPFYHKVEEYNNIEDRDLWFYELNLTNEEVLLLKLILFDQSQMDLDYYFLNGNCADKIYSLLTIIKNKNDDNHPLYFTPLESIRLIQKNIGTNRIYYRPSLRKLSLNLENYLENYAKTDAQSSTTALDQEIFVHEYLYKRRKLKIYRDKQLGLQKIRAQINQSSNISTEIELSNNTIQPKHTETQSLAPENSHDESEAFVTTQNNKFNLGLTIYAHDLLDYHAGYNKYSQLRLGTLLINTTEIKSIELFNFWNIQPHHYPDWSVSYRAELRFNPKINLQLNPLFQLGLSDNYKNANIYFLTGFTNKVDSRANYGAHTKSDNTMDPSPQEASVYLINTLGFFTEHNEFRFLSEIDVFHDFTNKAIQSSLALEGRYYLSKNIHFDIRYNEMNPLHNDLYLLASIKF